MATFLAGLTDEILPPLLYKPDYNLQFNELNIGTQKYNLYKDQLEKLWADYFNSPLTNFKNVEEREKIKKDVEEKLTKFAGLNFADIKVNEGIKGLINTVGAKKHIINDIAFTRKVAEFNTTLDLLKLSPGTKENNYLTYHPDQSVELDRQVREFASLKDDNAIANYKFREPIHKNYEKIVEDYIKDSGFKVKSVEVVEGGYYDDKGNFVPIQGKNLLGENIKDLMIVETKNGAYTIPEFHKMMEDYLVNNHGYGDYIAWKTDAELHKDLTNVFHTNDYMSLGSKDEILRAKWLLMLNKVEDEYSEYDETTKTYEEIYDKMNQRKQYIDYQIAGIEKKINDKQFSFNDIVELENLRQQKYELEMSLQRVSKASKDKAIKDQLDLLRSVKEIDDFKLEALKNTYKDMKVFNSINNMARTHAMLTMEQTAKESDFQLKRLGLKPAGGGSGNNMPGENLVDVEYTVTNSNSEGGVPTAIYELTKEDYPKEFVINKLHNNFDEFNQIVKKAPLVRLLVSGENLKKIYDMPGDNVVTNTNPNTKNSYIVKEGRTIDDAPYFNSYTIDNNGNINIGTDKGTFVHKFIISNEVNPKDKSTTKGVTIYRKPINVEKLVSSEYQVGNSDNSKLYTQKLEIDLSKIKNLSSININTKDDNGNDKVIKVSPEDLGLKEEFPKEGTIVISTVPEYDVTTGNILYNYNVTYKNTKGTVHSTKDMMSAPPKKQEKVNENNILSLLSKVLN